MRKCANISLEAVSNMTFQLLHSEFLYKWGKFDFFSVYQHDEDEPNKPTKIGLFFSFLLYDWVPICPNFNSQQGPPLCGFSARNPSHLAEEAVSPKLDLTKGIVHYLYSLITYRASDCFIMYQEQDKSTLPVNPWFFSKKMIGPDSPIVILIHRSD